MFEIDFAKRQATDARELAVYAESDKAKADLLTIARMWERLACEYEELQRVKARPDA